MSASSLLTEGLALLDAGQFAEGLETLLNAEAAEPRNFAVHKALARAYRGMGRTAEAIAADYAAIALQTGSSLAFYNLGTLLLQHGNHRAAEKWLNHGLEIDPDHMPSRQNLAAALAGQERHAEARAQRDIVYNKQCFIVETPAAPRRSVLVIAAPGLGNVPIDGLIPRESNRRILWFIEYAKDLGQSLPDYDLVLNAMGDPDMIGGAAGALERFLDQCAKPVMNRPQSVEATRRDRLPARLAGLEDVIVPLTVRGPVEVFPLPALIRPAGSHGGKGVVLAEAPDDLMQATSGHYLTQYWNSADGAGFFRKYRVIFVDSLPYPYHLAISPHWLVHYFSADMLAHPWKREEEHRFLTDPVSALGGRAMAALSAIGRRLDLDFAGVDFTLLPDGRILVFEANATMIVHAEDPQGPLAHKNVHVQRIFDAFETMMERRLGRVDQTRSP